MIVLIWPAFFDANKHALTSPHSPFSFVLVEFPNADSSCFSFRKAALRACTLISSRSQSAFASFTFVLSQPCFSDFFFIYSLSFSSFPFPGSSSLVRRGHLLQSSCELRSTPQRSCDVPFGCCLTTCRKRLPRFRLVCLRKRFVFVTEKNYFCYPCL